MASESKQRDELDLEGKLSALEERVAKGHDYCNVSSTACSTDLTNFLFNPMQDHLNGALGDAGSDALKQPVSKRAIQTLASAVYHATNIPHLIRDLVNDRKTQIEAVLPDPALVTNDLDGEALLTRFKKVWVQFQLLCDILSAVYMHMDRRVKSDPKLSEVRTSTSEALTVFTTAVFEPIKQRILNAAVNAAKVVREDKVMDPSGIKSAVEVFVVLGLTNSRPRLGRFKTAKAVADQAKDPGETYRDMFEKPFMKQSASQLAAYAQSQVGDVSVAEYLQHVQTVLSREKAMAESFFHPSTTVKHEYSVWKALFADAHNDLLTREPGLLNMLNLAYSDNDVAKRKLLRTWHALCARRDLFVSAFENAPNAPSVSSMPRTVHPMARAVQEWMTTQGLDVILSRKARIEADAAPAESRSGGAGAGAGAAPKRKKKRKKDDDDDPAFVADLLKWFSRCKSLVDNEFSGHSHYSNALRTSCSRVLGATDVGGAELTTVATLMAFHTNKAMSNSKLSDEEFDATLKQISQMLEYYADKDQFLEEAWKAQVWRLMAAKTNYQREKALLASVAIHARGYHTLKRMQQACDSVSQFNDNKKLFAKHWKESSPGFPEFNVKVFDRSACPDGVVFRSFAPTPLLARAAEVYSAFYNKTHPTREVTYNYMRGECLMTFKSAKKTTYKMRMYPIQAAILSLFNIYKSLTLERIQELLDFSMEEPAQARTLIKSMVQGFTLPIKGKKSSVPNLLTNKTSTDPKKLSHTDSLEVNHGFVNKRREVNFMHWTPYFNPADKKYDPHTDRHQLLQAHVVRIMKVRHKLSHARLMDEVRAQASSMFMPNVKMIKRAITDCISGEYIERDPDDNKSYRYLA